MSLKIHPNSMVKSMKDPFEICEIQNPPKSSKGKLGAVFGSKERLLSILAASGTGFGAVLARPGRQVGAMLLPKKHPKARKNHSKNTTKIRCLAKLHLNEVFLDFSTENLIKIEPSWIKNCIEKGSCLQSRKINKKIAKNVF